MCMEGVESREDPLSGYSFSGSRIESGIPKFDTEIQTTTPCDTHWGKKQG